jgi:hypothetical protein
MMDERKRLYFHRSGHKFRRYTDCSRQRYLDRVLPGMDDPTAEIQ